MDEPRQPEAESEADLLISRIIDGEVTPADRARFEHLAASEPTFWRQLAQRQQDMVLLAEQVERDTAGAVDIELRNSWLFPRRLGWTMAFSGWAAVIIVGLTWAMITLAQQGVRGPEPTIVNVPGPGMALTSEEHLDRYLRAPYVLGTLTPVVTEVEELSDGRVVVRFIRRIEEVAFLDPNAELPVDETGELTSDPAHLRRSEPRVGLD
jgi:hypothetical protein